MKITIPHKFDPAMRPYQLEVLKNPARFKFLRIHRKAGKTALAINRLTQQLCLKEGKVGWYVAPTYTQAKEIVWRDPEMLSKYTPEAILDKTKANGGRNEAELAQYYFNSSVLALKGADKPDSLRGPNPAIVILDEVYLMKPEVWTEIFSPIAFANPEMEVWFIGTPKPTGKFWGDLYKKFEGEQRQGNADFFVMTLNVERSAILPQEMLEDAKRTMTEAAYRQEFMCEELADEGVVFRGVQRCVTNAYIEKNYDSRFTYQFGIDLAMHVDWTVCIGVNKQTHTVEVFERYNQIDYNLQKARMEALLRRYGNALANVDQTGVGEPIVQDLVDRGLNINGIVITESQKKNLITNLALWIEQGKIKIPKIPELLEELAIFGYEILPSGRIRYGAPQGAHDDCVIALALAVWELGSKLTQMPKLSAISSMLLEEPRFSRMLGADLE